MVFNKKPSQHCLACGWVGGDISSSRGDGQNLLRCQRCKSIYLECIPESVVDLYSDSYFSIPHDQGAEAQIKGVGYEKSYESTYLNLEFYWAYRICNFVADVLQEGNKNRRCLDVGAATGKLLNVFMAMGYKTYGIELSNSARDVAKGLGHEMSNEVIEQFHLNHGGFDVVTALEVIEHVEDLPSFFSGISRVMSENGLFLGYFPSADDRWFGATADYHWLHNSFEHLIYPSEIGIRFAMERAFGKNVFVTTFLTVQGSDVIPFSLVMAFKNPISENHRDRVSELFRQLNYINDANFLLSNSGASGLEEGWKKSIFKQTTTTAKDLPFLEAVLCSKFGLTAIPNFVMGCEFDSNSLTNEQLLDLLVMAMHGGRIHYIRDLLEKTASRDLPSGLISELHGLVSDFERNDKIGSSVVNLMTSISQDSAVSERDAAMSERDAAVSERDAAMSELYLVYHSTSWRIAKPLRGLVSFTRLLTQVCSMLLRQGLYVLSSKRLKKGFTLLKNGSMTELKAALALVSSEGTKRARHGHRPEPMAARQLSQGQALVSVVIPCFNYGRFVTDAIDSILAQTLKNVEIVVVDGGSTDVTTVETLKGIQRPRTRILFREGRHLVGDNRNYGIEKAGGRYICCLDADDTLDPTYLEKAVFHLETYGYDIVSTAINFVGAREGHIDTIEFPDLADMVRGNHVLTCAVFRKELWDSAGGYVDIGVGKHHVAEDWDFWLRLAARGARIRNISGEYLFNYRIHEGGSLSSAADVKSIADQKTAILDRNSALLSAAAYKQSTERQSKYLRCDPSRTALAQGGSSAPTEGKKTLLLAMPFCLVGGAERLLSGLCMYLANHDWRIIVISTLPQEPGFGSSIDWFRKSSSEVYSLPNFLEPREWADFIDYLLASRKPDCLLNAGSRLIYELLPSIKKSHTSLSVVDLLFNTIGHVESHTEFQDYISLALAENKNVHDWYVDVAGWPAGRVRTVSSGVDLKRFFPKDRPKELVDKYGINNAELVVGFSGRLSEEKAPDVFVDIAKLCQEIPNLRFMMTGTGPMAGAISKQIKALPMSVKFEFAGLVDDVDQYLALYDVLVLPSSFDGRPLVVMEALACGVTVVASNVGGVPDLIEDGKNGYLVAAANAELFAARICALAQDRAMLSQLKVGARNSAEARLDANQAYRAYDIALCEAIGVNAGTSD